MVKTSLIWIAVAALTVVIFLNLPSIVSSPLRSVVMTVLKPLILIEHSIARGASVVKMQWQSHRQAEEENRFLRFRVKALSRDVMRLQDLEMENMRLRRLLDFREVSGYSLIPAQVIGRDAREWYASVMIDKGTRDGVNVDMSVITEEGVVGKVVESAPNSAMVMLIVDKRSRVGGIVERTRENGLVAGTSFNTCRLNYLPRNAAVQPGDRILTSGIGGVYSKGLPIGVCIGVAEAEGGLYTYADIAPGMNVATLEEVLVMKQGNMQRGRAQ